MTNRRDYGTFSKAAVRMLKPLVAPLGYIHFNGSAFGRQRDAWVEGFFLHQSAWGSGEFWVEVGLHIPALDALWKTDAAAHAFGLTIGARLDEQGVTHGAQSYPAANTSELKASLERVSQDLTAAQSWFAQFSTMADIAAEYQRCHEGELADINSGLLLLLAGKAAQAKEMLEKARCQWQKIVAEEDPWLTRKKPGKEAQATHQLYLRYLAIIESALKQLP